MAPGRGEEEADAPAPRPERLVPASFDPYAFEPPSSATSAASDHLVPGMGAIPPYGVPGRHSQVIAATRADGATTLARAVSLQR